VLLGFTVLLAGLPVQAIDESIVEPEVAIEGAESLEASGFELTSPELESDTLEVEELEVETGDHELDVENLNRLLISEFQLSGRDGVEPGYFVEVYNNSDDYLEVENWQLQYVVSNDKGFGAERLMASLNLKFAPHEYVVFGGAEDDDFQINVIQTNATQGYIRIVDDSGETVDALGYGSISTQVNAPLSAASLKGKSVQRCETVPGAITNTGSNTNDFKNYEYTTPGLGIKCPSDDDYNQCIGLRINEIGANLSEKFIEVINTTESELDITGCKLATSDNNSEYVFDDIVLSSGEIIHFYAADLGLSWHKTTSSTVYIYGANGNLRDAQTYKDLAVDTSWAWFGGSDWRQTFKPTPGVDNEYEQYKPCAAGWYRAETGYCRKVVVESATVLAECGEGKYRNPETNRCKSLASLAAAYSPCADGYYRNPETNRCKKIAAESSELKPCQAGYERNPETNRCRKIRVNDGAGYGVKSSQQSNPASFVGWLAFGGVVLAGLGYVGFEFHHEIVGITKKILHITGKK
jgi:hypothetical protein